MLRKAKLLKFATWTAGGAFIFIGVLHTSLGRPILAFFGQGGCPAAFARASAEQIDQKRAESMTTLKGERPAPSQKALGFTLMKSTKADVAQWATGHGLSCADEMKSLGQRCRSGNSDADDILFRFDTTSTLVAIDVMHQGSAANFAIATWKNAVERAHVAFGTPDEATTDTASLDEAYAHVAVKYRFTDLAVDLTATNFGERGVVVREQYRAISD